MDFYTTSYDKWTENKAQLGEDLSISSEPELTVNFVPTEMTEQSLQMDTTDNHKALVVGGIGILGLFLLWKSM